MNLTWKTVFKVVRQCLVEITFSLLAGHCLYIGLYRLDIGLEFWTRLWHYLDINAGPCSVWSRVHWDINRALSTGDWYRKGLCLGCCGVLGYILVITLKFLIYLIKNIHSYLSKVFSEAPLDDNLSHVGAMQHDLPCESVEWLLHGAGFCWEVLLERQ